MWDHGLEQLRTYGAEVLAETSNSVPLKRVYFYSVPTFRPVSDQQFSLFTKGMTGDSDCTVLIHLLPGCSRRSCGTRAGEANRSEAYKWIFSGTDSVQYIHRIHSYDLFPLHIVSAHPTLAALPSLSGEIKSITVSAKLHYTLTEK